MPVEGFKSITVSEATHKKLEEISTKNHRSMAQTIEFLIDQAIKQEA